MKVGDLVVRNNRYYPIGKGIVLRSYKTDNGLTYHEVQWFNDDRMWYDEFELEVFNESR